MSITDNPPVELELLDELLEELLEDELELLEELLLEELLDEEPDEELELPPHAASDTLNKSMVIRNKDWPIIVILLGVSAPLRCGNSFQRFIEQRLVPRIGISSLGS